MVRQDDILMCYTFDWQDSCKPSWRETMTNGTGCSPNDKGLSLSPNLEITVILHLNPGNMPI